MKNKFKRFIKSNKYNDLKIMLLLNLVIMVVLVGFGFGIFAILSKRSDEAEALKVIEENGLKYISIKNGYIAEELKVQAGSLLPNLNDYFNKNYQLDEDASIAYLEGKESLEVSDFTYKKDNNTYVRGVKNLTALIKNNNEEYTTKLIIEDTEKPYVLLQNIEITEGEAIDASRFVAIYVDNSQITDFSATIIGTYQYVEVGNYDVKINVCDSANNCVIGTTKLVIKQKEVVMEEDISSFDTGSGEENNSNSQDKPIADPSITSLSLNNGNLSPSFKSSIYSYKTTVEYAIATIRVNASLANGSSFVSGYGNRNVNLKVGTNTIYVKVKNSENKITTYKILVTRKNKVTNNEEENVDNENSGSSESPAIPDKPTIQEKERIFIEKRTSQDFPYKVTNHYGTKEYHIAKDVVYNFYSDNYVEVIEFSGPTWTEWDFTNYKTDVKAMKSEAEEVLAANSSTRQYFLEQTNATRAENGIAPVVLDYDLCIIATIRTFELTYGNTLSHVRPDGQRFFTILKEYGFKAGYLNGTKHYGENMAYWQLSDSAAYNALVKSAGHKQNILDSRWKKMGIGTFTFAGRKYWIQLFTT